MRNYCSMCMKLWVSLAHFSMKLGLDGRGYERNRKTKHELFVLILIRGRIASKPADCWESYLWTDYGEVEEGGEAA